MRQAVILLGLAWLSGPAAGEPAIAIHREILDNGLEVVIAEEHSAPIVTVQMWYQAGSKHEPPDGHGFAPLGRQILGRGPTVLGQQTPWGLVGVFGGKTDSYVSFDNTVFWSTLPANQLELAIWLEAQRITNPRLDEKTYAQDRQVVIDQRRQRIDARPFGNIYELVCQELFGDKPYGHIPAGNVEHLQAATLEEFTVFIKQAYAPNNSTLVIYGAVETESALGVVKKYLGTLERQPDLPSIDRDYPIPSAPRRVAETAQVPVPFVAMLHVLPGLAQEDLMTVRVLERVLAFGQGSPFYDRLVAELKLAHQAATLMLPNQDAGVLGVGVICRENVDPAQVEEVMADEFRKIIETGVSAEQLQRARSQSLSGVVNTRQTTQGMGARLGVAAAVIGRPQWFLQEWELVSKVTAEDLQRVARSYLDPAHRVTLVLSQATAPRPRAPTTRPAARPTPTTQGVVRPVTQPAGEPPAQQESANAQSERGQQ